MKRIKDFFKRLLCQHEYLYSHGLHCFQKGAREKVYSKKKICANCGTVKYECIGVLPKDESRKEWRRNEKNY